MYYLQSRYYNPDWGRFINADSIAGQIGELLSHNVFAYCNNNPINKFDKDGYMSSDNMATGGGAGGGGAVEIWGLYELGKIGIDKVEELAGEAQEAIEKASSVKLAKNMIKESVVRPVGTAAHHIVAGTAEKAQAARDILAKFSIGINDAVNGVFLPIKNGISDAVYHPSMHTNSYYNEVNNLLKEATTREEAREILIDIGKRLVNGEFLK